MATPRDPLPEDILIPEPPDAQEDPFALEQHLVRQSKTGGVNAKVSRQHRAVMIAIAQQTVATDAIAAAAKSAGTISNPPTQAEVQALQATLNAAIDKLNAAITRTNEVSAALGAIVAEAQGKVKSIIGSS